MGAETAKRARNISVEGRRTSASAEGKTATAQPGPGELVWRGRLRALVESGRFQYAIIGVIVANSIVIGLQTSPSILASYGGLLDILDKIALGIFIVEIGLKIATYRIGYFRSGWNLFDFTIVAVALVPGGQGLTVLRTMRILRVLRLLSAIPTMRLVVQGLFAAIPSMGSVLALLGLVFYIFAVMATKLFGAQFPEWFANIGASSYTLFQIMALESWSMGIVRPVMEVFPHAWLFFVPFILLTSFAVLNLFIAIIVNSMNEVSEEGMERELDALSALRLEVRMLREELAAENGRPKPGAAE